MTTSGRPGELCARASKGHATAAPPRSVMNSRRLTVTRRLMARHHTRSNWHAGSGYRCPLWALADICSAIRHVRFTAESGHALAHVCFVPCVDGAELARAFSRLQHWSVQPCVRPLRAAHGAAGHNALRGSGPDQKHAFDNALAHVGCPDRRIDRLCITCCSPFPTFTSRRMSGAISFTPQARWVPCSARPWPSAPRPSAPSCWRAQWRQPCSAVVPAMP